MDRAMAKLVGGPGALAMAMKVFGVVLYKCKFAFYSLYATF